MKTIQDNFNVEVVDGEGWKHSLPDELPAAPWPWKPIVVVKTLPHWLASIERNPMDFHQCRRPEEFGWPEEFYALFMKRWQGIAPFVWYEEFIRDFRSSLDALGAIIGAAPHSYVEPQQVTGTEWKPEYRERYL